MDYFFSDYNWIERKVYSYAEELKTLGITDIVGISRGGIFTAFLAAQILDIPAIHLLHYDRSTRTPTLQPWREFAPNSIVLLCEDSAGSGSTLTDSIAFLQTKGCKVYTLVVTHFNGSTIIPNFGHYSGETICVYPWERHRIHPQMMEDHVNLHNCVKHDSRYSIHACDLDGIFLPDIKESAYQSDLQAALKARAELPPYSQALLPIKPDGQDWVILSARPSIDRTMTESWLQQNGIDYGKLLMRDESVFDFLSHTDPMIKARKSAESKAAHIRENGITHFYESDAIQAVFIAEMVPFTRVCWWNNHSMTRKWITAEEYSL